MTLHRTGLCCLVYLLTSLAMVQASSLVIVGDAFVTANADTFSINNSSGAEARNRAPMPVNGVAARLYVTSNLQPAAGSAAHICVRVNGSDSNLCVDYSGLDWPATKGNLVNTVAIARGDAVSLHYIETGGVSSGANIRASFEISSDVIFENGFETVSAGSALSAAVITGEPFMLASTDTYSIGGSNGAIERNRSPAPRDGTLRRLSVLPNLQPAVGSLLQACINVNGADTAQCVNYSSLDWPLAKANNVVTASVNQGDLISVHFRELLGISSTANLRASFDFAGAAASGAVVITDEPFMTGSADTYSIAGSTGVEGRNSAAAPRNGQLSNLFVMPNLQPAVGSSIRICLRVNGADTSLCVNYAAAQWPSSAGITGPAVSVNAGDRISVRFRELNGVSSGANFRASFNFQ